MSGGNANGATRSARELGHRTFVLDLSETADPPQLPDYDWWMFDERVVLRFAYDGVGAFLGAEALEDRPGGRPLAVTGTQLWPPLFRSAGTGPSIRSTGARTGSAPEMIASPRIRG